MDTWVAIWKSVLIGAIGLFAVLSVWVTVRGFGDIRRMFRDLREARDDPEEAA